MIVRQDLPYGFLASQVVHAAGESSPGNLDSGTFAVVLAVQNESELLKVCDRLRQAVIPHKLIREPDSPHNNAATAIGLWPTRDRKRLAKILGRLPLLK